MDDDFGLWDLIVAMFWFMLLVAWFWLIISILADLFRDRDLKGGAKALWTLFIIVVPWLGALIYILVRGDSMHERERDRVLEQQAHMRTQQPPSRNGVSHELRELAELRDRGVLTSAEYEQAKAKALT